MTDYTNYEGYMNASPAKMREDLRTANGVQLTEALFIETIQAVVRDKYTPVYSLRDYDNRGKPSAYQIYMHATDESEAALKLVGSYSHWRKLCSLKWFLHGRKDVGHDGLMNWRKDMLHRDRTAAKKQLQIQAELGNVTAARALDKMAVDEMKEFEKSRPKLQKKGGSDKNDGLEFLDEYRS